MRHHLAILLLLSAVLGAFALTEGEKSVLSNIFALNPGLAFSVTPAWTKNSSMACDDPPFYGLTCSPGPDAHVVGLEFDVQVFSGRIPAALGELVWLETLSLLNGCYASALSDVASLPLNLKNLALGDRSDCPEVRVAAAFPSWFGDLKRLETLSINFSLSGTLPTEIGNLVSLRQFHLLRSSPNLIGAIPSSFWKLQGLESLILIGSAIDQLEPPTKPAFGSDGRIQFVNMTTVAFNYSSKEIDGFGELIERSPSLAHIDVSNSLIYLTTRQVIPLASLTYLDAHSNSKAYWSLRSEFWEAFPAMEFLSLADARLIGSIDSAVGTMKNLRHLDLSGNSLVGILPKEIGSCKSLQILNLAQTGLFHPIPDIFELLADSLEELSISNVEGRMGTLPPSIGALTRLKKLILSSSGLTGTIPSGLANAPNLTLVRLDNNALTGTIPNLMSIEKFDAHNNRLSGTIPSSIGATVSILTLNDNLLGPDLSPSIFNDSNLLENVNLAHNLFKGPLPETPAKIIDYSFNEFNGTVPERYCESLQLILSHNKLSGPLGAFFSCGGVDKILLNHNEFEGGFPDIQLRTKLTELDISHNAFTGALPIPSQGMIHLSIGYNKFNDSNYDAFLRMVRNGSLKRLDLSGLGLRGHVFTDITGPQLKYLLLADNRFTLDSALKHTGTQASLVGLDLSNNHLEGSFPATLFSSISVLKLSGNLLRQKLELSNNYALTYLDISNNWFEFEVSQFKDLPLLTHIDARRNGLYGSLSLDESLPSLEFADFSGNRLNQPPDFRSIGQLFKRNLIMLNISNNEIPIESLKNIHAGLEKTSSSFPSMMYPETLTCYQLAFYNRTGATLVYDENLFSYDQCECNGEHFGAPPKKCIRCPSDGVSSCGGPQVVVPPNMFALEYFNSSAAYRNPIAAPETSSKSLKKIIASLWTSLVSSSSDTTGNVIKTSSGDDLRGWELHTETCLITTAQTLSGVSNCDGIRISSSDLDTPNVSMSKLLVPQCRNGSEGRLCSRCTCKPERDGECYYLSGATCHKCKHVYPLSVSLPVLAALILIAMGVLILVMVVVLRRKRVQNTKMLKELALPKRLFYRFLHLISLGNVSILVTFLQMLLAFTQWDAYTHMIFVGLVNGHDPGLGLPCLFPFLSDPMWALVTQLSLPIVAIALVASCIGISGLIVSIIDARKPKHSSSGDFDTPLLRGGDYEVPAHYPTLALISSTSISILRFLYFGTALASHEYLFSSKQTLTGHVYIQSQPWMLRSDSWSLIGVSIPSILIFDLILPVVFLVICWRFRTRFALHRYQIYFGSLFESFNPDRFWWEIVNTIRKLSIAFALRALSPTDAAQSALVVTVLAIVMVAQVRLNPWRRSIENFSDTISSVILIGALVYTRPGNYAHANEVVWYLFGASVVFVLCNVAIIVWKTVFGTTEYDRHLLRYHSNTELNTQSDTQKGALNDDWPAFSDADASALSM